MKIKFGVSMQWWQFDHHDLKNLREEAEILKNWGLSEVRIITPSPPTWDGQALCSSDYAYAAQLKITSLLRSAGISTTFLLANSLSSVISLFKNKPEYNRFWIERNKNDYDACVDLIHHAIVHRNFEVLDLIEREFDRYAPLYDRCQLINAGELFLFEGRDHFKKEKPVEGMYNKIHNIKKFFSFYKKKNVFWNSANIYLQGSNVEEYLSLAVPFGYAEKIDYISEFNITGITNPEERANAFGVAIRKIALDFGSSTICFHSPFGGWFVLDENKDNHKLWTREGNMQILSDEKYKNFNAENPLHGDKFNLFLDGDFSNRLIQTIKRRTV